MLGGVTLLDPRVTQGGTSTTAPAISGTLATGVATQMEKVTARE